MIRRSVCNFFTIKLQGMTLIELLVVVSIVGILASIVYPNYQRHILKTHRSAVVSDLLKIQLKLEHERSNTGSYDYSIINNSTGRCEDGLFCQANPERYKFEIISGGSGVNFYQIKAIPQTALNQDQDKCGTLILNTASIGRAEKGGKEVEGCWP